MKLFDYRTIRGLSLDRIRQSDSLLILPHHLTVERKELIVTLLVNALSEVKRRCSPILVEANIEMLDFLKQAEWVRDTILYFKLRKKEDWDKLGKVFSELRNNCFEVIVDIEQKGITQEYSLLNPLKSAVVDAIRKEITEKRVEHPSLSPSDYAEALNFASRRFGDPIDAIDYINLFCARLIDGDGRERALRRSYVEVIIPYLENISTRENYWKFFFALIAYKGNLDQIQQELRLETDEFNQILDEFSDKLYLRRREDDKVAFLLPPFNLLKEEEYWITFSSFLSSKRELSEPYQKVEKFITKITREFRPYEVISLGEPKPALINLIELELLKEKLLDTLTNAGLHTLKEELTSAKWDANTEAIIDESLKQETESDKRSLILLCRAFSLIKQERWFDAEKSLKNTTWSRSFFPKIQFLLLRFSRIFIAAFDRLGYPDLVEEYCKKATRYGEKVPADEAIFLVFSDLAGKWSNQEITEENALSEIQKQKEQLSSHVIETLVNRVTELGDQNLNLAYYLAKLTYESARLLGDEYWMATSALTLANLSIALGELDAAIPLYDKSLEYFNSQKDRLAEVNLLGVLADVYAYRKVPNQPEKAIEYYQEALKISQEIGDGQNEARQLANLGIAYRDLKELPQQSIAYFDQALQISRKISNRWSEGLTLFNLGIAYHNSGQLEQAIKNYQDALRISRELGDKGNEGLVLANLGTAYHNLGQIDQAINFYLASKDLSQEMNDSPGIADRLANLGFAYQALGQLENALKHYKNALKISREIDDRNRENIYLEGLGDIYHQLSRFEESIGYYQEALTISSKTDRSAEGRQLNSLGLAYQGLKQWESAIKYHQQALEIYQEIGDRRSEATCLSNLGVAYENSGQLKTAIDYYQQALKIIEESGDRIGEGELLQILGSTYRVAGEPENAVEYYQRALEIAREMGNRYGEMVALSSLADAYRELDQFDQAIGHYEQTLTISREISDVDTEKSAHYNLAVLYEDGAKFEKAHSHYSDAILRIGITPALSELDKEIYQRQIHLCLEKLACFKITEQSLANLKSEGVPDDVLEKLQSLKNQEVIEEEKFLGILKETIGDEQTVRFKSLILKHAEKLNRKEEALEWLEAYRANSLSNMFGTPINFSQLMKELLSREGRNAVLIECFRYDDSFYTFLLRSDSSELVVEKTSCSAEQLTQFLVNYRKGVIDAKNDVFGDLSQISECFERLVSKHLQTGDLIYFVPHDLDYYLPLGALRVGQGYLIESHPILHLYSATLLYFLQTRGSKQKIENCAIFGVDSVNEASTFEEEAKNMARLFEGESLIRLGEEVTKEDIIRIVGKYQPDVIYFATPVHFDSEDILNSGLLLYNQEKLTIRDIFSLKLPTELIILGGGFPHLDTAENRQLAGGVSAVFLYAGASAVLFNLWPTPSSATEMLMQNFYHYLRENPSDKGKALQKAQLALLHSDEYSHPSYWAPFILIGK